MPPQTAEAEAAKFGLKPASAEPVVPPISNPDTEAAKFGLTAEGEPSKLQKGMAGAGIRAVPLSARVAEYFPLVGGTVGGILGDIPGAFAGGMLGKRVEQYLNALTGFRQLPDATAATGDLVSSGIEQGTMEVGGKLIGKALKAAPFRPTAPADVALAKANTKLGLRISPADIVNKSPAGMVGQAVDQMAERSVAGRVIGDLNRQVTARVARDGIVSGKAALNQVGEALHQVVTSGPAYDMFPHRVEAANLFASDVAPKILDLYARKLPPELVTQLKTIVSGRGVSPDLVQQLIPKVRKVIQRGQAAPVPTGTLDALESILQTADTASFDSATKLRTSLLEIGRRDDAVMGDRGKAVTKKFAGDLTGGMASAYPPWDPLRRLYASGAEAQRLPSVSAERTAMQRTGPTAYNEAVRGKTGTIPKGTEPDVLQNLRTIDDALSRVKARGGQWGDRIYRVFELSSAIGAGVKYGPEAAAGTLAVTELLPGMMVWAAHNPTMTKLLQEGLTTRDLSKATTLLGRVTQAYVIARDQAQKSKPEGSDASPAQ